MLEALQNHKHSLKESEPEPRSSELERPKPRPEPKQTLSEQVPITPVAAVLGFGIGAAICWFILQKEKNPKSSILKTSERSNIYDPFDL